MFCELLRSSGANLLMSCASNVLGPSDAPAGASTPSGNGFASVAGKVSPLSSVGTNDVVCENPGWKLPAMMNGTV